MNVELSIEQLMQQALAGDQTAYNAVLNECIYMLRGFLSKRLPQKSDMEDVLQEILISLHKARHTYDGKRPFKPWLFAIARYRLQDYLRKYYADTLRQAGDLSEVEKQGSSDAAIPIDSTYIHTEISRLPSKQARILRLIHGEGYTAGEVAANLGMQESAVRVAAHRAYKSLRKRLAG